jgi:hypothetical protein
MIKMLRVRPTFLTGSDNLVSVWSWRADDPPGPRFPPHLLGALSPNL